MSERVNQVREALPYLWDDRYRPPEETNQRLALYQAARDYADLLARLEDGSAYRDAAKVKFHTGYVASHEFDPHEIRGVVDAAFGLQEDE